MGILELREKIEDLAFKCGIYWGEGFIVAQRRFADELWLCAEAQGFVKVGQKEDGYARLCNMKLSDIDTRRIVLWR